MKKFLFLSCLFFVQVSLFAQGVSFDLKKIKNKSFIQKTTILDPDGKIAQQGSMTTIIRVDEKNNVLYQIRHTSGGRKDSTVCRLSDMKPIYFSTKGEGMNQIIEHLPGYVNAYSESDGKKISKGSYEVSTDVYDYFMDSYLVSLLPLKEGFRGSFNVFSGMVNKQLLFEVVNVTKDFIYNSQKRYVPAYLVICENAGVKINMWFDQTNNDLVRFIAYLPNGRAFVRDLVYADKRETEEQFGYEVFNRNLEKITEGVRNVIRFNEAQGNGLAWIKDKTFSQGIIEFDAKGRDEFQRSFIGVAFHGVANDTYEAIYFRPFNFQATDPVRKIHAVQYISEPKFGFQVLRDTRKDQFEAAILPTIIKATDWFHVKIEVKNDRVRVFVDNSDQPCLDVLTLNPKASGGRIGFWVGNNSNGDFANMKIY